MWQRKSQSVLHRYLRVAYFQVRYRSMGSRRRHKLSKLFVNANLQTALLKDQKKFEEREILHEGSDWPYLGSAVKI